MKLRIWKKNTTDFLHLGFELDKQGCFSINLIWISINLLWYK